MRSRIKKYSNDVDTNIMEKEKLITQLLEKGYSAEFIRDIIELTPKPTKMKTTAVLKERRFAMVHGMRQIFGVGSGLRRLRYN